VHKDKVPVEAVGQVRKVGVRGELVGKVGDCGGRDPLPCVRASLDLHCGLVVASAFAHSDHALLAALVRGADGRGGYIVERG
jgi:hypothetical protein